MVVEVKGKEEYMQVEGRASEGGGKKRVTERKKTFKGIILKLAAAQQNGVARSLSCFQRLQLI